MSTMQHPARSDYLATEVMTATPQKLRLMLIEAAIRGCQQATLYWERGDDEKASENLIRCQEIVAELVAGLRTQSDSELVRQVAGIYLYIHRALVAANLEHNADQLAHALRVLEVERETWVAVCAQLGSEAPRAGGEASFVA